MIGTELASELLRRIIDGPTYLSVHHGDPGRTGANELTDFLYPRQLVAMSQTGPLQAENVAAAVFDGLPKATATHVGIWSAQNEGALRFGGALAESVDVFEDRPFVIEAGDLVVKL